MKTNRFTFTLRIVPVLTIPKGRLVLQEKRSFLPTQIGRAPSKLMRAMRVILRETSRPQSSKPQAVPRRCLLPVKFLSMPTNTAKDLSYRR